MEKIINPLALFCLPAQLFLISMCFEVCYLIFFKLDKSKPVKLKFMGFLLFCLAALGWSFIINYVCGYEKYIAWGLAAIPLLYFTFK
jgi:hypothetical protein